MATKFVWAQPKQNTDGSAFDAAQFAGYELEVDGAAAVSVPVAWNDSGNYELPFAGLSFADGSHVARIRVKHVNGAVSDFSDSAAFTVARQPVAPFGFAAI